MSYLAQYLPTFIVHSECTLFINLTITNVSLQELGSMVSMAYARHFALQTPTYLDARLVLSLMSDQIPSSAPFPHMSMLLATFWILILRTHFPSQPI
jgi:hypothetical protein